MKAGKIALNHNQGLRVQSAVQAGRLAVNHNTRLVHKPGGLEVRSGVSPGQACGGCLVSCTPSRQHSLQYHV